MQVAPARTDALKQEDISRGISLYRYAPLLSRMYIFIVADVINIGEIKLPLGEKLTQISWSGFIPSQLILYYPFVEPELWEKPLEVIKVFKRWREDGHKIRLLITQTPVNLDVFIKSFDYSAQGGMGHYKYSIELLAAKELVIRTVEEAASAAEEAAGSREYELEERAAAKTKTGFYLRTLRDIWTGVRVLRGQGSWSEVEKVLERNGLSVSDVESPLGGIDRNDPLIIH